MKLAVIANTKLQADQTDKNKAPFIIRPFDPISAVAVVNICIDSVSVARVRTNQIVRVNVNGGQRAVRTSADLSLNLLGIGTKKHTAKINATNRARYHRLVWNPGLLAGIFKLLPMGETDGLAPKNNPSVL